MKKEISLSLLVIMLFLSMPGCSTSRMWNAPHPVKVQRQPLPDSALHIKDGTLLLQQDEHCFYFFAEDDAGTKDLLQNIETASMPVPFYYNGIHINPNNNDVLMKVSMSTENESTDFMLKGESGLIGLGAARLRCVKQKETNASDLLIVTDKPSILEIAKRTAYAPAYLLYDIGLTIFLPPFMVIYFLTL